MSILFLIIKSVKRLKRTPMKHAPIYHRARIRGESFFIHAYFNKILKNTLLLRDEECTFFAHTVNNYFKYII